MADDRRGNAAAPEVNDAPERPESRDGEGDVPALNDVSRAERGAEQHDADPGPAQILLEAPQHERPLHFLAHAPADDHHEGEDPGIARSPEHVLERVPQDVVRPWRE